MPHHAIRTGSRYLDQGKTPAEWSEILCTRGVNVTERTLREKANKLKTCGKLGNEMLILPEQLDEMFSEDLPCHLHLQTRKILVDQRQD